MTNGLFSVQLDSTKSLDDLFEWTRAHGLELRTFQLDSIAACYRRLNVKDPFAPPPDPAGRKSQPADPTPAPPSIRAQVQGLF